MSKNTLPPRGTKRQPTKTVADRHAENSFKELNDERAKIAAMHKEMDRHKKLGEEERAYNHAVLANGYRLLFLAEKSGHLSLDKPSGLFLDDNGKIDHAAYNYAVKVWLNNCYDVVNAAKLEGQNWRFNSDWKATGRLFLYDQRRIKRVG